MTGPELNPCPFCCVSPHVHDDASHSTAFFAGCYNDNCPVQPSAYGLSRAEAIAAWNTSPPVDYAALPEVQAMIAGVLELAASMIDDNVRHAKDLGREIWPIPDIRALIPADAIAARDAMIAEAVAKEREACAKVAHDAGKPFARMFILRKLAGFGYNISVRSKQRMCVRIAAAIRKRGEG